MRLARLNTGLDMWNADLSQGVLVQAGTMVQVESARERWVTIHAPGGLLISTKTNGVYVKYLDYLDEGSPDATSET